MSSDVKTIVQQRWAYIPLYYRDTKDLMGFDIVDLTAPQQDHHRVFCGDEGLMASQEERARALSAAPELIAALQAAMQQIKNASQALAQGRPEEATKYLDGDDQARRSLLARALGLADAEQIDATGQPVPNAAPAPMAPAMCPADYDETFGAIAGMLVG
ncbi:hypothetical protein HNP46_004200 [Pseudomonas nitritireducens]|uniref:Uncharacterized protein n=1 Tax=Pseudomonas nitroreducens TaxID=46680 RepID=A0A7W7KM45_PSENT|nr:hypothetical protein [Pseudomonas nitritireducens]MBB4865319.1 hypothetical protein [Pseudomonas nitritireducens]